MPGSVRLDPPLAAEDHVRGKRGAPLELVMFGDFQCPYCVAAQPILRRLRERLGERLLFCFRHFPITERHPDAQRAAETAEAAGAQGAFWEMHDALYARRGALAEPDLLAAAGDLGLDVTRVERELRERTHAARVQRDLDSGRRSGVLGTPGFYANEEPVRGAFDARSLIDALERNAG